MKTGIGFPQILIEKARYESFQIYAYCLMDNHVHILLSGMHDKLGTLVKIINTSYVYYFNKKYGRVGHLFHDRYKSEPVESDFVLIDSEEKSKKDKHLKGDAATGKFIRDYLTRKGIKLDDLKLKVYTEQRRELIAALKEDSGLSIRQIARILDVNRGMVQRV